jgi:hypothetical protein
MSAPGEGRPAGRVLFELRPLGAQVRVAAIDEATGTEVVVIAPASASEAQMQAVALAKLRRALGAGPAEEARVPPRGRLA